MWRAPAPRLAPQRLCTPLAGQVLREVGYSVSGTDEADVFQVHDPNFGG